MACSLPSDHCLSASRTCEGGPKHSVLPAIWFRDNTAARTSKSWSHAVPGDARKKCVRRIRSAHRRSSYTVPYITCSARSYVSRSQTRPCIGCSFAVHSAFDLSLRRHNTTEHTLFWCFSRSTTVHSCCKVALNSSDSWPVTTVVHLSKKGKRRKKEGQGLRDRTSYATHRSGFCRRLTPPPGVFYNFNPTSF